MAVCLPLLIGLLVPWGSVFGQQQPKIAVEVKVVNILATVHDKKGQIASTLGKDDFTVEEDGRPQTIAYFSKDNDLPLTLGLLVDTSMSQRRVLDQERSASHSFLDDMVRQDKDKAFVLHFDSEVELLQDLTASRDKLEHALDLLNTPQFAQQGGGSSGGGSRSRGGAGTLLYDAVYLASDQVIKKQAGRKALIVLSDGVDHGSKETLATAIETAQRADTVVYSILFTDDQESHERSPFSMGGPGMGRHGGGGGGGGGAGAAAAAAAAGNADIPRKIAPTARKFWNGSPRRRAGSCSRFPRKSPSIRFSAPSRKTFAINTASATRHPRMMAWATTRFIWPRNRKI